VEKVDCVSDDCKLLEEIGDCVSFCSKWLVENGGSVSEGLCIFRAEGKLCVGRIVYV
jgi:hypothetical protein